MDIYNIVIERFERESALFTLTKFADAISGLVGLIFFANELGSSVLGLYFIAISISSIGLSVPSGIFTAIKKRGSEKNTKLSYYYSTGVLTSVLYSILFSVAVFSAYEILTTDGFLVDYKIPVVLVIASVIRITSESIYYTVSAVYESKGSVALTGLFNSLRGILETIIQIILLLYMPSIFGITNYLWLFIGSSISTIILILIMHIRLDVTFLKIPRIEKKKEFITFASWSSMRFFIAKIESNSNVIIISILLSASLAGIYGSARRISKPAIYVSQAVSRSLFINTSHRDSNDIERSDNLETAIKYSVVLAIPMFVGSTVMSGEVLSLLYTETFTQGQYLLIGIVFSCIFESVSSVYDGYLNGLGDAKPVTISLALMSIISIPTLVLAIYAIGINGVILSYILSRIIRFVYLQTKMADYVSIELISDFKSQVYSSLIMVVIVFSIKQLIDLDQYTTALVLGIGATVYSIFMILLDDNIEDKASNIVIKIRDLI